MVINLKWTALNKIKHRV